ncbi:MAG: radical SAM protein [Candidatus Heimdallarchaeum endolithica]|uniref:Radical SAM protein n=1 Tax=Candidatus Heimdallarchaeum endolithica TaxID=2876572 RepID=A0A9Y1BSG2_9ARCH|nr:MAG: radical SAM protein [Candidatus Heimdallarchaeum endolithica]
MNILIIDALASNDGKRKFTRDVIGVGPRLLAGICESKNIYSKIIRAEDLLSKNHNYDLTSFNAFLVSGMSVDLIAIREIVKKLKEEVMQPKIFVGGPITSDIKHISELKITAAVQGQGELFLDKLIEAEFNIQSFVENYREQFVIEKIGRFYLLKEKRSTDYYIFNYYPSTRAITDYEEYWFARVYVETVRGCSNFLRGTLVREKGLCPDCGFCSDSEEKEVELVDCPANIPPGCGFCSVPSTFGAPVSRPHELIVKEIRELFNLGVNRIVLSAPGFLDYMRGKDGGVVSASFPEPNTQAIEQLLSELAEIRDEKPNRSIIIENVKPTLVNKQVVEILGKYLPNTPISIGCETFDEDLSRKLGRPSSPKKAIEASKLLTKAGLRPQIYLIHSLPGETVLALEKTIDVVRNHLWSVADKVTVYKYLALPNSPFTKMKVFSPPERYLLHKKREELKQTIISFNREKKKKLVGKTATVIISERDFKRENTYIGYFINAGPAISIEYKSDIIKRIAKVKITDVLSDKLVKAEVIELL